MQKYAILVGIDQYEDDQISEMRYASADVKVFKNQFSRSI